MKNRYSNYCSSLVLALLAWTFVPAAANAQPFIPRASEHRPPTVAVGVPTGIPTLTPGGYPTPPPNCSQFQCGVGCNPENCAIGCGFCGDEICNRRFEDEDCRDC